RTDPRFSVQRAAGCGVAVRHTLRPQPGRRECAQRIGLAVLHRVALVNRLRRRFEHGAGARSAGQPGNQRARRKPTIRSPRQHRHGWAAAGERPTDFRRRFTRLLPAFGDGTPVRLGSAVSSTADGANTSFYGSNAISGFVLDQTQYNSTAPGSGIITQPGIASTAAEIPLTGTGTTYGFAQPALPAALPAGVGASRTTPALAGNVGGLNYTTAQPQPYIITGPISINTDAATNKVQATIAATAQSPSAGYNTLMYQFGTTAGNAGSREAFIDDRNFAVLESDMAPQQANGQNLMVNGDSTQAGKLYLVNANVAPPPASLLPAGASYCQCQYLQWGYWGGDLLTGNTTNSAISRIDRGHINFWAAGVTTPLPDLATLQSQGAVGTYNGHAIGS